MELIIFFLTISLGVIGFFIKRHFFPEQISKGVEPRLHVSPLISNGALYAEIHSIGEDSIKDLMVSIDWLQNGNRSHRPIYQYFNSNQDPVLTSHHECNFLKIGEVKKIAGLPQYSDDGCIVFRVKGRGVNSSKDIEQTFIIKNEKK